MIIKFDDYKTEVEDIKFNLPENIKFSGRLLIIGGSYQNFSDASEALNISSAHGAINSILALPNNLKNLLPKNLPSNVSLFSSDKTGSFNLESKNDLLNLSLQSGGVLFPGQMGRGSQTSQLVLSLIQGLNLPITMAGDSILFLQNEDFYLDRPNIFLFLSLSLVQRLMGKFEVISYKDPPNIVERKLKSIADNVKLNFCFFLEDWLYALIEKEVIMIKIDKNCSDIMMPNLASVFASIKTWSKAQEKLNLILAIKIIFQL
jgi:hypothetical protein